MQRDLESIISGKDNDTYAKIVRVAAKMMLGLTHLFNTARTGFKYDLKWRRTGKKEAARVNAVAEKIVAKILK